MKREKIAWMTGSCKYLGWSLKVFPIHTAWQLHVWKMKLWILQTRNFINHFLSLGYPLQRIWYRKFCLVLWHRFWPRACIDSCGFSALVQQGFPGMSMHPNVNGPCDYSWFLQLLLDVVFFFLSQIGSYTGSHSSATDVSTFSLVPLSLWIQYSCYSKWMPVTK